MPLPAGAMFDRYRIERLLGVGGMGEVYLAHDTKLDRHVALKLLPADLASDAKRLRRFELEARAASALHRPLRWGHSGLISLFEPGPSGAATLQRALRHRFCMVPPNSR